MQKADASYFWRKVVVKNAIIEDSKPLQQNLLSYFVREFSALVTQAATRYAELQKEYESEPKVEGKVAPLKKVVWPLELKEKACEYVFSMMECSFLQLEIE